MKKKINIMSVVTKLTTYHIKDRPDLGPLTKDQIILLYTQGTILAHHVLLPEDQHTTAAASVTVSELCNMGDDPTLVFMNMLLDIRKKQIKPSEPSTRSLTALVGEETVKELYETNAFSLGYAFKQGMKIIFIVGAVMLFLQWFNVPVKNANVAIQDAENKPSNASRATVKGSNLDRKPLAPSRPLTQPLTTPLPVASEAPNENVPMANPPDGDRRPAEAEPPPVQETPDQPNYPDTPSELPANKSAIDAGGYTRGRQEPVLEELIKASPEAAVPTPSPGDT